MKLNLTKCSNIEYIVNYNDTFLKTVSAFANQSGGKIYFGVDENANVIGIDDAKKLISKIEKAINDNVNNRPKYNIDIQEIDDKLIVILEIEMGLDKPYYYDGIIYVRNGNLSVEANEFYKKKLIMLDLGVDFESITIDNNNLSFAYLERYLRKQLDIDKFDNNILKVLGLLKSNKYTKAGLLFSDNNEIGFGIDINKYGENKDILEKRKTIVNVSVLEQFDKAMEFFDNYYSDEDKNKINIARDAFKEALANAIIHRDYMIEAYIKIEMDNDKIVIVSPGGLVDGMNYDDLIVGKYSLLRNPIIANIFNRLDIIARYSMGIKRINDIYNELDHNIKFEISLDSVCIILPTIKKNN